VDVRDGEEEPKKTGRPGGFFGLFRSRNDSQ